LSLWTMRLCLFETKPCLNMTPTLRCSFSPMTTYRSVSTLAAVTNVIIVNYYAAIDCSAKVPHPAEFGPWNGIKRSREPPSQRMPQVVHEQLESDPLQIQRFLWQLLFSAWVSCSC
jgi:hypothetical protein